MIKSFRMIHYEAESDDHGARVFTSLSGTPCPFCKRIVEPNIEHLCGNRVVPELGGFKRGDRVKHSGGGNYAMVLGTGTVMHISRNRIGVTWENMKRPRFYVPESLIPAKEGD